MKTTCVCCSIYRLSHDLVVLLIQDTTRFLMFHVSICASPVALRMFTFVFIMYVNCLFERFKLVVYRLDSRCEISCSYDIDERDRKGKRKRKRSE